MFRKRVARLPMLCVVLIPLLPVSSAQADNFSSVRYDPKTNEIVAQMVYRGTNANHTFSLRWGRCMEREDALGREIEADVIDNQWDDAALHDYRRTARFDLSEMTCRPARVTLRSPPGFYYTLFVPYDPSTAHVVAHPPGCRSGYRLRGGSTCIPVVPDSARSESNTDALGR